MKTAFLQNPINLTDETGKLANNIAENWLIGLRETNPAILDIFHERDRKPYRELLPWSGEFAGKYITGAYYIYQLNHHKSLYSYIINFLEELLTCIDDDGYVGCFQKECRLTGAYSQSPTVTGGTWDAWAHYHIMFGLYLWYQETKDKRYLGAVEKIAEFFMKCFYSNGKRLIDIGSTEMNLSPLHIFAILYRDTGNIKYLTFAQEIEQDLAFPTAGNYINHALSGIEFYKCPKPRWESLHIIMGIATMYEATKDIKYKQVAEQIFYSILKTDIHNTGGFSTEEEAIGTPFTNGNIELCCVIAYNALACEILKLTEDPKIVDFLELSLYNAVMGSFSPSCRWSTYNTPMEGIKAANYQSIVFQSRPGSPDLNCCSVNAARGVGMLSEWAVMEGNDTIYLNYFGKFFCKTASGVEIKIDCEYPVDNKVNIYLKSQETKRVAIRIPAWSNHTVIEYKGNQVHPQPGEYWVTEHIWNGEIIQIKFDFSPRLLKGEGNFHGKNSIYVGPILYGYDLSLKDGQSFDHLSPISLSALEKATPIKYADGRICLNVGGYISLCDFYHLGMTGSAYKTWFECKN